MPSGFIADNVTEVVLQGHWTNNRKMYNIVHIRREEDDPAESARDVLNNWQDHIVPLICNNYTLEGAGYVDHNEAEGVTGFLLPDNAKPKVGGDAGSAVTPNTAVLVKKNIEGRVGRRSGRMYIPPPSENDINEDGGWEPAASVAWQAKLTLFFNGLSGAGGNQLVVVHQKPAPMESPTSLVTGLLLDPVIATQRRRLRG